MRLIIRKTLLMFLLLSLSNVLTGFQLSAQEQNKKFSVKADNVTLKEAIEVVRKQGNYSFLIRNNDIDLNKKVSVNVDKGTINDVMAQLLTGTGISYEVNGNRVVIFHAAVPEKEQGKAFVLKGKVTDPSGEGVIGANVKVLNSTEGTITDMDGNFSLSVTPNARLSVSYIGYATQEVVVKNQTPLHIALKEDSRLIDEVVVVGYGVQKKANLTGAVSSVKMDEVLDAALNALQDGRKRRFPDHAGRAQTRCHAHPLDGIGHRNDGPGACRGDCGLRDQHARLDRHGRAGRGRGVAHLHARQGGRDDRPRGFGQHLAHRHAGGDGDCERRDGGYEPRHKADQGAAAGQRNLP